MLADDLRFIAHRLCHIQRHAPEVVGGLGRREEESVDSESERVVVSGATASRTATSVYRDN